MGWDVTGRRMGWDVTGRRLFVWFCSFSACCCCRARARGSLEIAMVSYLFAYFLSLSIYLSIYLSFFLSFFSFSLFVFNAYHYYFIFKKTIFFFPFALDSEGGKCMASAIGTYRFWRDLGYAGVPALYI